MTDPVSYPSASTRHRLPFLFAGQAQKEFFLNEALARIDALLHPAILGEQADPPAVRQDGDAWLVAATATGSWAGHEDTIAVWQGDGWLHVDPTPGLAVRDLATGEAILYDGGWTRSSGIPSPSGGTTIDSEGRAAIDAIIAALENKGILPAT